MRLKSISFLNRYDASYRLLDEHNPCLDSMEQTIMATSTSLRSLGIFSEVFRKCNAHRLSSLAELTLVLLSHIDHIEAVFVHCLELRSLTLLGGVAHSGDIATILDTHYDTLPLLTAFRLGYSNVVKGVAEAIAKFLGTKPLLERLDISHPWDTCPFEDAKPILDVLPRLPRLRVLGFELGGNSRMDPTLTAAHLLYFNQSIPQRLTAVSLWVALRTQVSTGETDWIQLVSVLSLTMRVRC